MLGERKMRQLNFNMPNPFFWQQLSPLSLLRTHAHLAWPSQVYKCMGGGGVRRGICPPEQQLSEVYSQLIHLRACVCQLVASAVTCHTYMQAETSENSDWLQRHMNVVTWHHRWENGGKHWSSGSIFRGEYSFLILFHNSSSGQYGIFFKCRTTPLMLWYPQSWLFQKKHYKCQQAVSGTAA